ncbi:hypothetical protein [Embleya sp. MST-111070]|uniref:hypothetical protein n=1 Tax=Embleya sp. MST-111070 TaxID=3398231 RepID=UPI003F741151
MTRVLQLAVEAWLRVESPDATVGYALGHLLVRVAPDRERDIPAMLRRLDAVRTE